MALRGVQALEQVPARFFAWWTAVMIAVNSVLICGTTCASVRAHCSTACEHGGTEVLIAVQRIPVLSFTALLVYCFR